MRCIRPNVKFRTWYEWTTTKLRLSLREASCPLRSNRLLDKAFSEIHKCSANVSPCHTPAPCFVIECAVMRRTTVVIMGHGPQDLTANVEEAEEIALRRILFAHGPLALKFNFCGSNV